MKIAVTKGTLRIPPTYFVISHAEMMKSVHSFELFTLIALVAPHSTSLTVHQAVPASKLLSFKMKTTLIPLFEKKVARQIVNFDPDVVHQHFGTWAFPAVASSQRLGVPLITTLHGADVHLLGSTHTSIMANRNRTSVALSLERSAKILAVSDYLANKALALGADPRKIEIHYQGIDTDYFSPSLHPTISEVPEVLFVGNHSIAKGARDVFSASIQSASQHPHRLTMIGGGPLLEELRREAREHSHIQVLGPQNRSFIRDQLRQAAVFMSASQFHKGWTEAAGLVNLEAQACGVPVVGYASGGIPEMVDPEASILVPEGDQVALGKALARMLSHEPHELESIRSQARNFAVQKRSLARSCEQLETIYNP